MDDIFRQALAHHHAGRVAEAEALYRRALALAPDFVEGHYNLGLALQTLGKLDESMLAYKRALTLKPDYAEAFNNIGIALETQGKLDEAVIVYQRAVALKPNLAEAYNNLGNAFKTQGKLGAAVAALQRALVLKPDYADAHLNLGGAFQAQGKLDEAVIAYQRALALKPDFAEAYNNLGVALKAQGRLAEAVTACERALALRPSYAEAFNNLGIALKAQGKLDEAVIAYQRAMALNPSYAEPYNNLGIALKAQDKLEEAVAVLQRVLVLKPNFAEAHLNLSAAFTAQGKLGESVTACERALALKPNYAEAYNNLGNALFMLGKMDEAVTALRRALVLKPDLADAHLNLGIAFKAQGKLDEAVTACNRALALKPNYAEAHLNLAGAFTIQGKLDEAVVASERALALKPNFAEAYSNLGNALKAQGKLDEALARYRRALDLDPGFVTCHLNLLAGILYHPGFDDDARFAEHLRFARMHAPAESPSRPHPNPPDPRRKLRVGYVSADLRGHPVAHNLLPLVKAHDRSKFELYLYADLYRPDDMTARFRALADGWRVTNGLSDAGVADAIRADGIDILVCLAGHFDGNRPLVAAHKPAPVQVSFYDPATSGLAAVEYLIADPILVPRRGKESFVERVVRLPNYFIAEPIDPAPPVVPPPVLGSGVITFGCFNNPSKITDDVLKLWGALMSQVPGSRLLLKYTRSYASAAIRRRVQTVLGGSGVARKRIVMLAENQGLAEHLALYGGIDVALDPFPFCGATATFEALWMGVPVVTLAGEFMVGRWSASMLSAIGLPDLVASTPAEYIGICRRLAADPEGLAELRAGLRARVAASPLCDTRRRIRQIERLYRALWRRWCNRRAAPPVIE